ncbi:MAG: Lcl C-terminal domain-containing protein [Candidatus Electronema sp. V4]|uniref:Lcl C-terminal domain-containing protein n=1 Tax=Candidatus Electronema sp. V4 TaxID=3454756 RepID=UPI004055610D
MNDTGITWSGTGATGNNAGTTCSDAAQDCFYGWDKTDGSNAADGHAGFKFSKLDSSGNVTTGTSFECVRDERTGLIWEVKSSTSASWSAATTNTASFTACNVSAGNWRLPTVKELLSIVSYYDISAGPAVDPAYFPVNASSYWTGTELSSDTNKAWVVSFVDGTTKQLFKIDPYRFRLVYKAVQ